MSQIGKFAMELAEARVDQERDAGLARVRARLTGTSAATHCRCGAPIPEARRRALPNTECCVDCAQQQELRMPR